MFKVGKFFGENITGYIKQEANGPQHSPEKPVQINKHI